MIIILLMLFIVTVALDALLFYATTKIFRLNEATYKKALIVSLLQIIFILIIGVIISVISKNSIIITVLEIFFGLVIFHILLKKFYQTNLKKNIAIYIVFVIITVVLSFVIVLPVRSFVVEPFVSEKQAMEPTYQNGDYLLINKFDKNFNRGDVVIFKNPDNQRQYFIKRIIGLPGEKIQLKDGFVYLYDAQNPDGYKLLEPYLGADIKTIGLDKNILELSNNEYYVLGDNRPISKDSRIIGPVSAESLVGKIWFKKQ
ncbi:MAG TPA: signal peptidase I [bacterium]|nr:signal peptidase I [bacterium]